MKKSIFLVFVLFLFVFVNMAYAKPGQSTLNTTDGYYDPESGVTIAAAFEIGPDGSLQEIPLDDFISQLNAGRAFEKQLESKMSEDRVAVEKSAISPQAYNYYYYRYVESGSYVYTSGSHKQASASIYCNSTVPCPITTSISNTVSSQFSANVNTSQKQSAVKASVGFKYVSSATRSLSYTLSVPVGRQAYIGFYPKYNYSYGTLEYRHKWGINDDLVSSESANVSSPKELSSGEADGVYTLIYEN